MSADGWLDRGIVRLVFPADPFEVRSALARLFGALPAGLLDDDARGSAEIVITEVLNNIVEHAYAATCGEIEVTICPAPDGLHCTVTDHGRPLPQGALPGAELPCADHDDLPEGGFGWYLIRALSQDVQYCRDGAANRLTFRLPVAAGPVGG
jgi:serine/threonine-protein kinase RsbW